MHRVASLSLALGLCASTASAQYEPRLGAFRLEQNGAKVVDIESFRALARDLGHLVAPKGVGPASTTGSHGFDIGLAVPVSFIDATSSQWSKAVTDAPGTLQAIQLNVRKGLPLSFELGATLAYVAKTGVSSLGASLKWAYEGYHKYGPDIAVRVGFSGMFGARDLSVLVIDTGLLLSKAFGVNGVLTLTPYAGYIIAITRASSTLVGSLTGTSDRPEKFVIPLETIAVHHGALGLRLDAAHAFVNLELLLTGGIQSFTSQVGASF